MDVTSKNRKLSNSTNSELDTFELVKNLNVDSPALGKDTRVRAHAHTQTHMYTLTHTRTKQFT